MIPFGIPQDYESTVEMIVSNPLKVRVIPNSYCLISIRKVRKKPNDQLQISNESITIGIVEDCESTAKMIVSSSLKVRLIPNSYRIIQSAKFEKIPFSETGYISNR